MASSKGYQIDWVSTFLHEFPHIDFNFEETNSSFNPESTDYKESLVFLAAIPVAVCVLMLLLTFGCLCVHCCCKEKPSKKKSTTCTRFVVALFIIFAFGSVAVGFFGNEEGNKGIQTTVEAIQDTNDTLSGSLTTLTALDELAADITGVWVKTLIKVFKDHLKNQTLRDEVIALADEIKTESEHVRSDINGIHSTVGKISLDSLINTAKQSELYRWIGTISVLCWQILVLLIYSMANLKKSKCCLIWGVTFGFLSLLLAWVVMGAYLGGAVALSDFCVNPDAFVINELQSKVSSDVINSYVRCQDTRDPKNFSKALDDALVYIQDANNTLNKAVNKTKPYNISQYLEGPVHSLQKDLKYAQDNISSLTNTVYCGQIHSHYVKALTGVCNRALVGVSLILLVLPILGLSLMFIQCLAPRVWLLLGRRKNYRMVDDSDPFLPRPPPYNSYGTIGDERSPLQDPTALDEIDAGGARALRADSGESDSPPPAYYPGSFVEQYNNYNGSNLGTFPRRHN